MNPTERDERYHWGRSHQEEMKARAHQRRTWINSLRQAANKRRGR